MCSSPKLRGRYAPSPTGELHLGNASTALLAWLSARSRAGEFILRMEDLDRPRVREGMARQILDELIWLGLDWDEGPDRGGPHAPYEQSSRAELYELAFARLRAQGDVYPCFCSRRDIANAASAPQEPGDEVRYPGTCRRLDPAESQRRVQAGQRHAWRYRMEQQATLRFVDRVRGTWPSDGASAPGDFVIRRTDGTAAYQLAVVVDDHAMGINEVVRGDDLLASTTRQLALFRALDAATPEFGHVPLLLGTDGARLSKRHRGITIHELRERDLSAETIVGRLAHLLGLTRQPHPMSARDLLGGFDLGRLSPAPHGITVDPAGW